VERKRKHRKTLEPDDTESEESDDEPPESPATQTLLENLEDHRRAGWMGEKSKASEKSRKEYGKVFKDLQGKGVGLVKGKTVPGGYQECMQDWRKPFAGCSPMLRRKLRRAKEDFSADELSDTNNEAAPERKRQKTGKKRKDDRLSKKFVSDSEKDYTESDGGSRGSSESEESAIVTDEESD
jgi:hypothetical protein